jgi:hypothetical protein
MFLDWFTGIGIIVAFDSIADCVDGFCKKTAFPWLYIAYIKYLPGIGVSLLEYNDIQFCKDDESMKIGDAKKEAESEYTELKFHLLFGFDKVFEVMAGYRIEVNIALKFKYSYLFCNALV